MIGPKRGDVKVCAAENQHVCGLDGLAAVSSYRSRRLFRRLHGAKTDLIIVGLPLVPGVPIS